MQMRVSRLMKALERERKGLDKARVLLREHFQTNLHERIEAQTRFEEVTRSNPAELLLEIKQHGLD